MLRPYLFVTGFIEVGGYDALWEKFPSAIGKPIGFNASIHNMSNTSSPYESCYKITPYWANMLRPADDPNYPWVGVWTTLPIMGVWYWCTDQVSVHGWSIQASSSKDLYFWLTLYGSYGTWSTGVLANKRGCWLFVLMKEICIGLQCAICHQTNLSHHHHHSYHHRDRHDHHQSSPSIFILIITIR